MPQGFPNSEEGQELDNLIDLHTKVILRTARASLKLELDLVHYLFTMLYSNILKDDWCGPQMATELIYRPSRHTEYHAPVKTRDAVVTVALIEFDHMGLILMEDGKLATDIGLSKFMLKTTLNEKGSNLLQVSSTGLLLQIDPQQQLPNMHKVYNALNVAPVSDLPPNALVKMDVSLTVPSVEIKVKSHLCEMSIQV